MPHSSRILDAAQYDFEAWLLPYWSDIPKLAGHNRSSPPGQPEAVNHHWPRSHQIREIIRAGTCRGRLSADKCPELKALLNTILTLSGAEPL